MKKNLMALGVATSCLMMSAASAQAFTFKTNTVGNGPTGDILLESVEIGNTVITDFVLVNGAEIETAPFFNDEFTGDNTGAASSDDTVDGTKGLTEEKPGNADIVASLGNEYLSSIVDTEDNGSFRMQLSFDGVFNKLLFWERGHNSDLEVTINNVTKKLFRTDFDQGITNYKLETTEITPNEQEVGSYGIDLAHFGITGKYSGPVILSTESAFNGPDFKVVGVAVPEPATMLGLGVVAGAGFLASRRKRAEA